MPVEVASALGVVLAVAATIAAYIMIMPAKKRETLSPFLKWLHDFFNFKTLWLEKILKAIYVFFTMVCVCTGVMMIFSVQKGWSSNHWMGGYGFLMIIVGPIVVRIIYEALMLFIILVRNSGEINNKLTNKSCCEKQAETKPEETTINME